MMLKVLGVALTVVSCGIVGFQIASTYLNEISQFKQLIRALEFMENELLYRRTPLPDLCRRVSGDATGKITHIFDKLASILDTQVSSNVEQCMHIALSETEGLSKEFTSVMKQLGNNLGKYDIEGQINGIRSVKDECGSVLKSLENNQSERVRSIKTLGLCAGAAVAILLI